MHINSPNSRRRRPRRLLVPLLGAALLLTALSASAAQAATALYPNLRTLPPRDLRFDRADVSFDGSGQYHNVLRFSNTVWNTGEGKLEIRGQIDPVSRTGPASQRVYEIGGTSTDYPAGGFYWHGQNHQHYHYDDWGKYELWDRADYDAWIASGRTVGQPDAKGTKTTSCVMDEEFIRTLPTTPFPAVYPSGGCLPNGQNVILEGLSVGWGDTYDYYRDQQWIDLDQGSLANGQYVLRSVTDPKNQVYESSAKADTTRESEVDNEGITYFSVQNGQLVDTSAPSGTVAINDVDPLTSSKNVTVKLIGRDDIAGVDQVRISKNGTSWRTQAYTTSGSDPTQILCDLTDPALGGIDADGPHTVLAQFRDRSGKWSSTESDSIVLDRSAGGSSSPYAQAVSADSPAAYWRLGETSGTTAADSAGQNKGTYLNGAQLGANSLISGDPSNKSVHFDGSNDAVTVPSTSGLNPTQRVSVEAWIKPDALPAAGGFASVLTKPEAYSLQFNGPKLEFTIMQNGTRKRTQAPSGAIVAGQAYHVVGTYDGANARLYVNGVQVATTALTGAIGTSGSAVALGSWDGGQEFLRGTVDDAAVYGSALTAARVQAHYAAASSSAPPPPPPDPSIATPSGLGAIASSTTQVALQWTDNANNETQYVIQRDVSAAFSSPQTILLGENTSAYSDSGLTPGTQYFYRVQARSATNQSGWSNTASATTQVVPPPPAQGYAQSVLTDNPVSYWRLGEGSGTSALDQRAINPGVYTNAPTLGAPSLLTSDTANAAVAFDGSNDHVAIPNSASLGLSSPLTLEAWIKPTTLPAAGSFASVLTKAESYSLQFNGPQLELTIMQFGVRQRLQVPIGTIVPGQTYHVVATYDGTTRRLYVNGTQVASGALTGGATATTNGVFIGSWGGAQEFFNGAVDDVAVYGTALSAARVAAHHDAGVAGAPAPDPVATPTSLSASAVSTSQIDLQWLDNADNETEYVVERDTSSSFASPVSTTMAANKVSYSSVGLAQGTQYYFRVKARNATNGSGWSNVASATTMAPPPPVGYASVVLADNPVSHWRLGEASGTAAADQKAANAGTYVNAPTLATTSLLGSDTANKAVSLDGSNDHVRIPNSASLGLSSPLTLEAWIKPTTLPATGSFASVLTKAESYSLQFNGPRLELTIMQFGVRQRLQAPSGAIVAGQTYHVVGTYDGTTRRLYVNGTQVASAALTGGATATTNGLYVGSWNGAQEFFRGIVDEPAVYASALSAAQVATHYNAGK